MKKDDLQPFLNEKKKIKITLKNGYFYTCHIESLNVETVHIIDKFNEKHVFDLDEVVSVSEFHNGGGF